MNSHKLLNLGLLVLVVALSIIVMLDIDDESDTPEPKKISQLKSSDINQISIALKSNKHVQLKQINNQWRMTEPVAVAANDIQIFSLLGLLNTISYGQYKVAQTELAKYGLKSPSVTINFNQYSFAIGDENPVNHRRYALFNNNIHLISDNYSRIAISAPSSLINLALLPENNKIKSLHLPDMKLDLQDGQWSITPPPAGPVSQDSIRTLIDEWQFAQALNISILGTVATPEIKYQAIHIEFSSDTQTMDLLTFSTATETLIVNPALGVQYHLAGNANQRLFQINNTNTSP